MIRGLRGQPSTETPTEIPVARAGHEKQIRLALVCYGGVSLAIYMHGVTKEIHKLVVASRAYELDSTTNPFPADTTEHVYWSVLHHLQHEDGLRRHVVVDVISGTSAGGINGVFLAKALARNRSQDALKDIWMRRADIGKLMGFPWIPAPIKLLGWLIVGALIPRTLWLLSFLLPPGLRRRLRGLPLAPCRTRPPFRGSTVMGWLHEALSDMEQAEPEVPHGLPEHLRDAFSSSSLVPPGHALDLFVTATDYHGLVQEIWIADPVHVLDLRHRHVFSFRHVDDGRSSFGTRHDAALTFAAAATSAFPGAFPPVNLLSLRKALGDQVDTAKLEQEGFRIYDLAGVEPRDVFFVDGGVLDNFPFSHAIRAIHKKPAGSQVKRRLLFIEPDPAGRTSGVRSEPSWGATFWRSVFWIPREEPILDDLAEVRAFNERVRGVSAMVEHSVAAAQDTLNPTMDKFGRIDTTSEMDELRGSMHESAREHAGLGYSGYLHLKLVTVVRQLATMLERICDFPPDSNQAAFVREVCHVWARDEQILVDAGTHRELSKEQLAFLRAFDLEFTDRRLRHMIAWLNELYPMMGADGLPPWGEHPNRGDLNRLKAELYRQISVLAELGGGDKFEDEVRVAVTELFDPGAIREYVDDHRLARRFAEENRLAITSVRESMGRWMREQLVTFIEQVFSSLDEQTAGWATEMREALMRRYLTFPLADAISFPARSLVDVGELQEIDVMRISPQEAQLLDDRGVGKLKGARLYHFAGFFRASWRENDYLWGRIDAAERLISMLVDDVSEGDLRTFERDRALAAAHAVVTREGELRRVKKLRRSLLEQIEAAQRSARDAGSAAAH